MPEAVIKIGGKPLEKYREAFLYANNHFGKAEIRALGKRQRKADKLLEYAETFDGLKIARKEIIKVHGTFGVEAEVMAVDG